MSADEEWSPVNVWGDFDPWADDLDIETISEEEVGGALLTELTFFSHEWEGEPIIGYGILAAPREGSELPGILHIHGGGQTAFRDHVLHWARAGYVAFSFDWTGPVEGRDKVTDFGAASMNKYLVEPSPRFSHLYHGGTLARRALTLLQRQEQVNPDRLGIYGISWGGFLCWLVNGADPRVRASASIYGCGGTLKRGNSTGPDYDPDDEEQRLWNNCYSPFAYAEHLHGAALFLNCSNDFFGWMDTAEELYTILPHQHSLCFCSHFNHHLDEVTSRNLYAWMDHHLREGRRWPFLPALELGESMDSLEVTVHPHIPEEVELVEAYCASHHCPAPSRYWRRVPMERNGQSWRGRIPVAVPESDHSAFATVHYRRGISVSSIPKSFRPSDFGAGRERSGPDPVLDPEPDRGEGWFLGGLGTEPFPEKARLSIEDSVGGRPALVAAPVGIQEEHFAWNFATRKIAVPRSGPSGRDSLYLLLNVHCCGPLQIRLTVDAGTTNAEIYSATQDSPEEGWSEIELRPRMFKNAGSEELASFEVCTLLEVASTSRTTEPPALGFIDWI